MDPLKKLKPYHDLCMVAFSIARLKYTARQHQPHQPTLGSGHSAENVSGSTQTEDRTQVPDQAGDRNVNLIRTKGDLDAVIAVYLILDTYIAFLFEKLAIGGEHELEQNDPADPDRISLRIGLGVVNFEISRNIQSEAERRYGKERLDLAVRERSEFERSFRLFENLDTGGEHELDRNGAAYSRGIQMRIGLPLVRLTYNARRSNVVREAKRFHLGLVRSVRDHRGHDQLSSESRRPEDNEFNALVLRGVDALKQFSNLELAFKLLIRASGGTGMIPLLNELAIESQVHSIFSGFRLTPRSHEEGHLKFEFREVEFLLNIFGPPWGQREDCQLLIAVLHPFQLLPIDGMVVYTTADTTRMKPRPGGGLILGLQSHDEIIEREEARRKIQGMDFDENGAVIKLTEFHRVPMLAYMALTVAGAAAIGFFNPSKRNNEYAKVFDSITFISVMWFTVFAIIKLITNEPDVLRNLVLKKWILRTRTQVYSHLGGEDVAKKALALERNQLSWLSPKDMCFSRAQMTGNVELRGGLTAAQLSTVGYVTAIAGDGRRIVTDLMGAKTYDLLKRNGIFIIDKRKESDELPALERLTIYSDVLFRRGEELETLKYAGTSEID